ncbi:hypothetical protein EYF80_002942 [Liparis tanakae]|uniref:Uncharacterized protein n=1 Tax=Liparis tanakae TaxID=230148 RepID=A0A4Z2J983_9TELE|nr:hypothetical protein EYF80_002942 [Liparis tanakae]
MRESTGDTAAPSFFQWTVGGGAAAVWQPRTTVLSTGMQCFGNNAASYVESLAAVEAAVRALHIGNSQTAHLGDGQTAEGLRRLCDHGASVNLTSLPSLCQKIAGCGLPVASHWKVGVIFPPADSGNGVSLNHTVELHALLCQHHHTAGPLQEGDGGFGVPPGGLALQHCRLPHCDHNVDRVLSEVIAQNWKTHRRAKRVRTEIEPVNQEQQNWRQSKPSSTHSKKLNRRG